MKKINENRVYIQNEKYVGAITLHEMNEFGYLTIIKYIGHYKKQAYWLCKCICGIEVISRSDFLLSNRPRSCGCARRDNLLDKKFGRLLIIAFDGIRNKRTFWKALCDCGNTIVVMQTHLVKGNTKSCGCLRKEATSDRFSTHRMTNTRLWRIWRGMIRRCFDPNMTGYEDYGGRGITVCPEWLQFEGFYADEGESYLESVAKNGIRNTTADRWPNNDGNYEKGNFRWATIEQQKHHTRVCNKEENYGEHWRWRNSLTSSVRIILLNTYPRKSVCKKYLGISGQEFRDYIQSLWEPWMNWDNYGPYRTNGPRTWDLDHIVRCREFDLSKEEERKKCFNWSNMRPACSKENLQKH